MQESRIGKGVPSRTYGRSSIFYFLAEVILYISKRSRSRDHYPRDILPTLHQALQARFAQLHQDCNRARRHIFDVVQLHYWMPVKQCHRFLRRIFHHLQGRSGSTYQPAQGYIGNSVTSSCLALSSSQLQVKRSCPAATPLLVLTA